jgi:hypothetical protein
MQGQLRQLQEVNQLLQNINNTNGLEADNRRWE